MQLRDFKRFDDLTICDIPQQTRLVVLIGPNGCGKSSIFEAFLLKLKNSYANPAIDEHKEAYYTKRERSAKSTHQLANRIDIAFHDKKLSENDWKHTFCIRSPYRNEADFTRTSFQNITIDQSQQRFARMIDSDQSVANNYSHVAWKGVSDLYRTPPLKITFEEYQQKSLRLLQDTMAELFTNPHLQLQDFGGIDQAGTFRFTKGNTNDFHYKNLSGGEKAAFDLLLDVFVKRDLLPDAVYCIDEPESHINMALHGSVLTLISHNGWLGCDVCACKLWIPRSWLGFAGGKGMVAGCVRTDGCVGWRKGCVRVGRKRGAFGAECDAGGSGADV